MVTDFQKKRFKKIIQQKLTIHFLEKVRFVFLSLYIIKLRSFSHTLGRSLAHLYHNIHEKQRPDTTSTSVAKHFATCVIKPVTECFVVPIVYLTGYLFII